MIKHWLLSCVSLLWLFTACFASASTSNRLSMHGLVDLQLPITDSLTSSLDQGQGKFRFDESDNGKLRLGTTGVDLAYQIKPTLKLRSSLLYNADPSDELAVTESYLHYRPVAQSAWRQQHKIGAFYPTLSLENVGRLWTSPYTLTPSVINSWVGEEVRTLGIESSWIHRGRFNQSDYDWGLVGSVFWGNDTNGALLAWRGWSNTDRQTGLGQTIPLAPLPNLTPGGAFDKQAQEIEPFVEVDNRPGFMAGAIWRYQRQLELSLSYYDNQGDSSKLRNGQYAWNTHFWHGRLRWDINRKTRLLGQYIYGRTIMNSDIVVADFEAMYLMLSHRFEKNRVSLRWEQFGVDDEDLTPMDSNNEFGHSLTVAVTHYLAKDMQLVFEGVRERTNRMSRRYFNDPEDVTELQFITSLKIFF